MSKYSHFLLYSDERPHIITEDKCWCGGEIDRCAVYPGTLHHIMSQPAIDIFPEGLIMLDGKTVIRGD